MFFFEFLKPRPAPFAMHLLTLRGSLHAYAGDADWASWLEVYIYIYIYELVSTTLEMMSAFVRIMSANS